MKNVLILFLFILMLGEQSAAQAHNEMKARYGLKLGVNASNMNFNKGVPAPAAHVDPSWKTGLLFGFLLNVPMTRVLSVQPEYAFVQTAGEHKQQGQKYQMSYLSLPVLLKYQLLTKLAVSAGPQFDLLLKSTQQTSTGELNTTHDTEERNFSATAGVEINLAPPLTINLRYVHGLNHVGIGQRSNITEFKYEMLQLTGCFLF